MSPDAPTAPDAASLTRGLQQLETELWDLAFHLERQRRADGADVARDLARRLKELHSAGRSV